MLKKITGFIASAITILLFALTLYILIFGTRAIKKGELLKIFGYSYSVVVTNSMEDKINVGDIIIIKDVDFDTLKEEDIIVFYNEKLDKIISHQVYEILDNGEIRTIAYNGMRVDEDTVKEENYYGKVIKYGPLLGIGKLMMGNFNKNILFLLISILFLGFLIKEVINIVKTISNNNKKQIMENSIISEEQRKQQLRESILEELKKERENKE